ncbi:uncharacterized protein LOC122812934 [Protopterus annectens]|uniref:uncharacterized protein LOC122812934 n=1 Tax=Protopterus annectens TaxID=7888 RepID=UPI001CFBE7F7|nr:uncharacterized protein LOC122812934 [Protopterus annectens]
MHETKSPPLHPTEHPRLTSDEVIIIVVCCSCAVLLILIVGLLLLVFRRDRHCCRSLFSSCTRINSPTEGQSTHQSSLHLVDGVQSSQNQNVEMGYDNPVSESADPYIIAHPECYQLPEWMYGLPRLPSYESVRKKDRQQEIHQLIAERFGLNVPSYDEQNPPSYEESLRSTDEQPNESTDLHMVSTPASPSRSLEMSSELTIHEDGNVSEESYVMNAESNNLEQTSMQEEIHDSEVPVPCTDSNISECPQCTESLPP